MFSQGLSMKTAYALSVPLAACFIAFALLVGRARSEDPPSTDDPQEDTKKLNDFIESSVDWYEVLPEAGAKTPLRPQPVMRWRNVARGQAGEAMMVVWADRGRPEVFASIYPWEGYLHHEFGSLSRAARLVARDNGSVVWAPNVAGVEFKPVSDAPQPADTPAARLRQMKSIAERFKATMTGWKGDNSDREELRLLPRPLFRYDAKETGRGIPSIVDGALFAFVMGTDPEVVMLLEAVGPENDAVWQYAFARATSGGLEVKLAGGLIWTAEKYPANRGSTAPQLTLRRPLE
jgi:hypothetical protein